MADSDQDGLKRIGNVLGYMVAPHTPGDPNCMVCINLSVANPCANVRASKRTQVPPPPEELADVAYNTLLSAVIGALFQGSRQRLNDKRDKAMSAPLAKQQLRAMAEAKKQRLANVARAGLKGAGRFGSFSALFLGTKFFLGVYRDSRDYYNSICGGLVAGGAMGISIVLGAASGPATASAQTGLAAATLLRSVIIGSALGGMSGFAAGILEDAIVENLPEEEAKLRLLKIEQTMAIARGEGRRLTRFGNSDSDPVGDVIRQLEAQQIAASSSSSVVDDGEKQSVEQGRLERTHSHEDSDQAPRPWWRRIFWWS